jgi:glycosyltransferase involved in cell wall biosynthesis
MKILFFVSGLGPGGKERRLTELLKELKYHSDVEFELVIMSHDIHYEEVFDLNIPIHYLVRKAKRDLSIFRKLYKLCKTFNPDIIHCWDSMTAIYSSPVCKILHIPLINGMVIDSPQKQNIFNKYWLRAKLTFPFSNYIVGNSKAGIASYHAPLKKSIVIPNGFNFDRIKNVIDKKIISAQISLKSKFVIGMVASFTPYKDYKTFFKAAQIVLNNRTDITFLAIGSFTDSSLAKSMIESNKLDHFRLLGNISGVESYVNAMDICVLSTFTEGISNSILEYMALGKPVIATSGGGTNEIIENNKTGFLVAVSNPEELSSKMQILLQDENLRLKMGLAGKERIESIFSIEIMLNKYISLYHNVMSAR